MTSLILLLWLAAAPQTDDARALFERGLERQRAGDTRAALELFEAAAKLAPGHAAILGNLGVMRAQAGDLAGAVAAYTQALRANPSAHRLHLNIGIAWVRAGQFVKAVEPLDAFLVHEPSNRQALELRAVCDYQLGRFAAAGQRYDSLIAAHGEQLSLLYGLGESRGRGGDIGGAEQAYGRLFQLFPDAPQTRLLLAQKLLGEGRADDAVAELGRLSRELPGVDLWLGIALERAGRHDDALKAYRAEIAASGDLLAHYGAGVIESRAGDPQAAIRHLEAARPLDGDRYNASFHLAGLYTRMGNHAKALPLAEAGIKRDPESEAAHYLLMQIYQKMGRQEEARRQAVVIRDLKARELQRAIKKVADKEARSGAAAQPQ